MRVETPSESLSRHPRWRQGKRHHTMLRGLFVKRAFSAKTLHGGGSKITYDCILKATKTRQNR